MTRKTVLNPPKPPPNGSKMVSICAPTGQGETQEMKSAALWES